MRNVLNEGEWDHERTSLFQRKSLIEREEFDEKGRVEFQKSLVKKEELYQKKKCFRKMFKSKEYSKLEIECEVCGCSGCRVRKCSWARHVGTRKHMLGGGGGKVDGDLGGGGG